MQNRNYKTREEDILRHVMYTVESEEITLSDSESKARRRKKAQELKRRLP